jgi:hypothetical protein
MRGSALLIWIFCRHFRERQREKNNSNSGKYQEIGGPPITNKILLELWVGNLTIGRICYIIGGHHRLECWDICRNA